MYFGDYPSEDETKKFDFYVIEANKDKVIYDSGWDEYLVPVVAIEEIHLMLANESLSNISEFIKENNMVGEVK